MGNKTSAVAIAAANGLPPPSATVITLDNSVLEAGVYNRVIHSATDYMPLLLPPAPTDGMVVGVVFVGYTNSFATCTIDGNGKNIALSDATVGPVGQSQNPGGVPRLFRFDADQDLWTIVVGALGQPG
jgi:hypothetical protein